jgi:UDP-N-acetylglucosamine 2-epimerase
LDALSIVGGRPHLLKAESVDRGLRTVGHSHIALRAAIGRLSDYPADGDFNVPLLPGRLTVSDQRALVKPLRDVLIRTRPRVVLLYGDLAVTAAAYAAVASLGLPAVHVEAGYRSGDLSDPEERTRIELDHGVDAHLVYTTAMRDRLLAEDIPNESITLVPDPAQMALLRRLESDPSQGGEPARGLVTFHRTETLNDKHRLTALVAALERVAAAWPLTVVLYAEARYRLLRAGLLDRVCNTTGITTTSTMPLRSYAGLLRDASFVITDSSGVQDDCATLGRVCFVVRRASPRPIAAPLYLVEPASLDPARIEAAQSGGGPRTEQMAADSDADGLLGRGTAEALAIARRRAGRACADAA